MIIKVYDPKNVESVDVEIENLSEPEYKDIINTFESYLHSKTKSDAVADTYLYALSKCPDANPADLWWHVIYRFYLSQYSDQSWKRTAGYGLERVFIKLAHE